MGPISRTTFMKNFRVVSIGLLVLVLPFGLGACSKYDANEQEDEQPLGSEDSSGSIASHDQSDPVRQAFFGDLHIHTGYSLDSFIRFIDTDPRDAYQFAQGKEILLSDNTKHQIDRPLDFAAVTEHSEYLGELDLCLDAKAPQYELAMCNDFRNESRDLSTLLKVFRVPILRDLWGKNPERESELCGKNGKACERASMSVWQELQQIADEYYKPGEFTTFVGYEWTAGANQRPIHRNVIFRNEHVPKLPFSYFEAKTAEKLRALLRRDCNTDCDLIIIPHNSNLSRGAMFELFNEDGSELTREQARLRAELEPLMEIFQSKGSSECFTGINTSDEQCNFEIEEALPVCSGKEDEQDCVTPCDANGEPDGCKWGRDYARNVLKMGLVLQDKLGANPYKLGFIASTDTHNSTPGATVESNYKGHYGVFDASPETRLQSSLIKRFKPPRRQGPGGLAGVWSEENTRDSIFDALKRKETFGTSGTRIKVRVFGGWKFPATIDSTDELATLGYANGVPMGGTLRAVGSRISPQFLVWALKAPDGANLQKIQIIKGWVEDGLDYERVFDVICSGGNIPDPDTHRCPDNGANVNIETCDIPKDLGDVMLQGVWTDPLFNPGNQAFYYTRVLENPTCRWSTWEANRNGWEISSSVPSTIQERAWSSPIWYVPGK